MTPEEAEKLQELLRTAANALEDLTIFVYLQNGEDCALIEDLRAAIGGRLPINTLRGYAERCDCYRGDGPVITKL